MSGASPRARDLHRLRRHGDWEWHTDADGHAYIRININHRLLRLYPHHAPNDWSRPGHCRGWDGDRESPTLRPSIHAHVHTDREWHGWLYNGALTTSNPFPP